MSDSFWQFLFASIPPTLVAAAGLIVSLRNGKKVDGSVQQIAQATLQVAEVKAVAEATHEIAHATKGDQKLFFDGLRTDTFQAGKECGILEERARSNFSPLHDK